MSRSASSPRRRQSRCRALAGGVECHHTSPPKLGSSAPTSLLRVANEDDVGIPVAADDYKLFVVKGPVEIADEL